MGGVQTNFGTGSLYVIQANNATAITPRKFGVLQDINLNMAFEEKTLHGQYQAAFDIARGKETIKFTAKFAGIFADLFNQVFLGLTNAVGGQTMAENESYTLAAGTQTVVNSATFLYDAGVTLNGALMTRIASGTPTTGQYKVAAGVYTFATADNGKTIAISYVYTLAAGSQTIAVTNQLMGFTPKFMMQLYGTRSGNAISINFNSCTSSKLGMAFKQDDFVLSDVDISAMDDQSNPLGGGNLFTFNTTN
jgi:hypothetical protein